MDEPIAHPGHAADDTALVVHVPEAEPAVGALRAAHDWSASVGMPAHVTVLYPFVSESEWRYATGGQRIDVRLARIFAALAPFDAAFRATARFGDGTLYLVPEPGPAFSGLTQAVAAEFPAWPPYGGAHPVVIPHLTVAEQAPPGVLERCEAEVAPRLPVAARVAWIALFGQRGGTWLPFARWPLGAAVPGPEIVLRADGGPDEVRFAVERYEFGVSDHESADWLVVRTHVTSGAQHAAFAGPDLQTSDLPRLADFLDAAASGRDAMFTCTFTEPCLSFVRVARAADGATPDGAAVRIRVAFALERSLPWATPGDPHTDYGMPCTWADLDVPPATLRAAAAAARELAALWPSRAHLFPKQAPARKRRARRGSS